MIKKFTTAAVLATTMLGGTVPCAYGVDLSDISEDGKSKSNSSNQIYRITLQKQQDGSHEIVGSRLLEPQEIEAEKLLESGSSLSTMNTQSGYILASPGQVIPFSKEEKGTSQLINVPILTSSQSFQAEQSEEISGQQQPTALLEQQKKEAEEERLRLALEKEKAEVAARKLAEFQKRMLEEEKKREEAATQNRAQQAQLEREAEELINQGLLALNDYISNKLPNKLASHSRHVDERKNNAPYAKYTGGQSVKNHYLGVYANDDPNQELIKLSATDENLFRTLQSKWDRFPELEGKMRVAKLEQIKKELGITTNK